MRIQILSLLLLFSSYAVSANEKNENKDGEQTIVVISTRTALDIESVAGNIDKITTEAIESVAHVHIQELLLRVPGVNLQRGNGQEYLPAIRSPVLTGAGACGAFLMAEDHIPLRAAGFCNVNELFEAHTEQAESIEVIRGPGGVYYGSNSLHGIININTPSVPYSKQSSVAIEAGSYNFSRLKTSVGNSTIDADNDIIGYNLALTVSHDGGYRADSGYEQQKFSGRHLYSKQDLSIKSGLTITNLDQQTAGFILGKDSFKDSNIARSNLNPEAFRKAESFRTWSRFEFQIDQGKSPGSNSRLIITPYIRITDMAFRQHFLPGKPLEENGQKSLGFQSAVYTETSNGLNYSIGLDGEISDGFLKQTQDQPTEGSAFLQETIPLGKQYDYQVDARMLAPFIHMDWQLGEQWQLTSGIRYEYMEYDYNNQMIAGRTRDDGTDCGFGGCRYSRPEDSTDSFNNWSPKLGVIYQLENSALLFTNISRGFRAPQATELYRLQRQQTIADLKSVQLDSFELGIRRSDSRLSYELIYFLMEKKNVIYRDSDFFNLSNGQTEHQGFEARMDYSITNNISLGFNASFVKHQYASDQLLGEININGNDIDTAPRHFGSAQLNWKVSNNLNIEVEWNRQGGYYTDAENLHRYNGHDLINFRTNWKLDKNLLIFASIKNLLDRKYAERADYTSFTEERYFPGTPLSVFFGIQWLTDT